MALSELHAGFRERGGLRLSFDAFGDHLQRRRTEQRGQTIEPLRPLGGAVQLATSVWSILTKSK